MRNFHLISSLGAVSLLTLLLYVHAPAAGQPMAETPSQERSASLEDSPAVPSPTDVEEASAAVLGDDVAPLEDSPAVPDVEEESAVPGHGCSYVEICHPKTVCRQRGCSLGKAENECKREVKAICGAADCPLEFVEKGGGTIRLGCPLAVCSGNAIECGGYCCGQNQSFCVGTRCNNPGRARWPD